MGHDEFVLKSHFESILGKLAVVSAEVYRVVQGRQSARENEIKTKETIEDLQKENERLASENKELKGEIYWLKRENTKLTEKLDKDDESPISNESSIKQQIKVL